MCKDQKPLVAGRFIKLQNRVLRIRKREYGCKGCVLNNPFTCPNIPSNNLSEHLECSLYNVIFTAP